MLHAVSLSAERRSAWFLLLLSASALFGCALYFQFGLALEPCVKCVYQRVAVVGIGAAALLGFIAPRLALVRFLAFALWLVSAIWGWFIASEHLALQNAKNAFFMTCDSFPNFPDWAPLHQWFPTLFSAPGVCGDIEWSFAGLSMPAWMQIIFAAYALIGIAVVLLRLLRLHRI